MEEQKIDSPKKQKFHPMTNTKSVLRLEAVEHGGGFIFIPKREHRHHQPRWRHYRLESSPQFEPGWVVLGVLLALLLLLCLALAAGDGYNYLSHPNGTGRWL